MPTVKKIILIFSLSSFYFSFAQKWEEPYPLYICIDLKEKYIQSYSIGKNNEIASFAIYINGYESKEKRKKSIDNYAQSKNIPGVTPEYCLKLAWGTNTGYSSFSTMLTQQQQQEYNNIYVYEQNGTSQAKGTPCN